MMKKLQANGARLWETLEASAAIGAIPGEGLSRLCLTDADRAMRDLFVEWCVQAGCTITIDRVGNIFARRVGTSETAKPVMIGSHLDTQIAGGRYDGILGVLSGLEVIRTLNGLGIETTRPIEVVCWTNEEGVRFQPPMMGAGAFAGIHDRDWVLAQLDEAGVSFGDELRRIGYAGPADRDRGDIDSYFELHIEQGPVLEEEGVAIGIVTGGFTSFGMEVLFRGENAHSGAAQMRARKDALVALSRLVTHINDIGWQYEPKGRATCTRIDVKPNRYGIVADRAIVTVDVRHPDPKMAQAMYAAAREAIATSARQTYVEAEIVREWSFGDIAFDAGLVNLIRKVAAETGVSHRHILSAAGHDAYHISRIAPAVMIFTPCRNGVTHNVAEHIEPGYTMPGVNVLLNAVVVRANQ